MKHRVSSCSGYTPRREFLKGIHPAGPDRNALQRAIAKQDALLDCENRRYLIKKGEMVYFTESAKSYTVYSTLVRRKIAKLSKTKFESLFKHI